MIDVKKGHITLDNDTIKNQNSDFDSVSKMGLGEIQEVDDMGNRWIWLRIKNISNSGYFFNMAFAFKNEILKELSFIWSDKKFDLNPSWSDWSEKEELKKLKKYQNWLKKEIVSV